MHSMATALRCRFYLEVVCDAERHHSLFEDFEKNNKPTTFDGSSKKRQATNTVEKAVVEQ